MSGFLFTPMTRFYAEALQYMKNAAADGAAGAGNAAGTAGTGSFAGTVQEKLAQTADIVPRAGERGEQAVRAMSMDQYKMYIYQKISALPTSATQKWDAVSVNISEEGFAAMKADPAYEKWVLDTLRQDFAFYNPWSAYAGGSYRMHYFGATKQEYRGESFQMGFRNGGKHTDSAKKKQKSFWEKRAERHKMYMDLATKAWYKRENEREYQEKIDLGRKEVSSAILRQQAIERATGEKVELGVNTDVLSEAATELAQNYVFFKIPSALTNPKPKPGK
ncbi:MAG: hypothetical protein OSJ59_03170 [Lachnospiraceae bacterium]|nr:hypothetical protein [Lachnospiraceae bacterium]